MAAWIWILIPLTAILMGGFKEWLKFKSKQDRLGTSARALEDEVGALKKALKESEAERQSVQRRLENLETIVTSEAWDALSDGGARSYENGTRDDGAALNGSATPPLSLPDDEPAPEQPSQAERAAQMARRLGT